MKKQEKDQRLLLEKIGALKPHVQFGTIAELRNRLAHSYPDDSAKQSEILNEVFGRSSSVIEAYNDVLQYANNKFFEMNIGLFAISIVDADIPKP